MNSNNNHSDTVGNPHRAQISQFEMFELILLLKLDRQFPVEQFEATASQSTVPPPPLVLRALDHEDVELHALLGHLEREDHYSRVPVFVVRLSFIWGLGYNFPN